MMHSRVPDHATARADFWCFYGMKLLRVQLLEGVRPFTYVSILHLSSYRSDKNLKITGININHGTSRAEVVKQLYSTEQVQAKR